MTQDVISTQEEEIKGAKEQKSQKEKKIFTPLLFVYLGALLVLIGIAILLQKHFHAFTFPMKLVISFGSALVAYWACLIFSTSRYNIPAIAFYIIFSVCAPWGMILVLLHIRRGGDPHLGPLLVAACMIIAHLWCFFALPINRKLQYCALVFLFLAITSLYINCVDWIGYDPNWGLWIVILGLFYISSGFSLARYLHFSGMEGPLYFIGVFLVLLSAFPWLPGNLLQSSNVPEFIYPFLAIAILFLSGFFNSWSFALWSMLFLLIELGWMTNVFFSGVLGWPLLLIILGLLTIVLGYMAIYIKQKSLPFLRKGGPLSK